MCEQAGTGLRMMREEWQSLGHPLPVYKNDRSWKAFEFFIPGLDIEVDMASDLMQAMFTDTKKTEQVTKQTGTKLALSGQIGGQIDITSRQQEIIDLLNANNKASRKSIAKELGISESAVQKHLTTLKKKGIIRRVGTTRGHWEVLAQIDGS